MSELLDTALAVAGLLLLPLVVLLWAALRWWGSGVWASREDLDGLGGRVDRIAERWTALNEQTEANEDRLSRLEQDHGHQQIRIAEQVIAPLQQISDRLGEQSVALGRLDESMKGLKVSVDDLRKRMERQEERGAA